VFEPMECTPSSPDNVSWSAGCVQRAKLHGLCSSVEFGRNGPPPTSGSAQG
jgi:hypothetical protein